jgi:hypothetical protein
MELLFFGFSLLALWMTTFWVGGRTWHGPDGLGRWPQVQFASGQILPFFRLGTDSIACWRIRVCRVSGGLNADDADDSPRRNPLAKPI